MLFLKMMANPKNRILYADNETSVGKIEVELSSQTELYGGEGLVVYEEIDELSDDNETIDTSNEKELMEQG